MSSMPKEYVREKTGRLIPCTGEAQTFPHLPEDLQVVARRLASWGLVAIVNNNVVATSAGRALIAG